jgi:flagella basal body P-ring formation protein FlgA
MSRRLLLIILTGYAVSPAWSGNAAVPGPEETSPSDLLQIHLPREVTVQDTLLSLGQISVLKGVGPLAETASEVRLGRFSAPGQKIVLDRPTILSRLASQGIPQERVHLTGAETVTVRRQQQTITGDEFIALARLFLQQNPPVASPCDGLAAVTPKDLTLAGEPENIQLTPRFVENGARGFVTVQIRVVADGREVGSRDIPLRLRYRHRRAVASQEIAEGATLTPENVRIEEAVSDRPETPGWKPPFGSVALRAVPAGMEVGEEMAGSAQSSVVIRRNETVVIRIQRPGFLVSAVGQALQEARAGEYIKVRNSDSRRIIMCKVSDDGTVEPVL